MRKEKREETSPALPWPPVWSRVAINIPGGPNGGHKDQDQGGLYEGSGGRLGFVSEFGVAMLCPSCRYPKTTEEPILI